jgi:hypothetical protein
MFITFLISLNTKYTETDLRSLLTVEIDAVDVAVRAAHNAKN